MCLYPKLIENPKYKPNKKNGGKPPFAIDKRVKSVAIGCGKCMECMRKKRNEWLVRLSEETREKTNGKFVTLTFSNENYEKLLLECKEKGKVDKKTGELLEIKGYDLDNAIATLAVRRFTERWRKKFKRTIRHWLITELGHGKTEHLHLHGIVWTDENVVEVEKIWGYGYVWKGVERPDGSYKNYVNEQTSNYITKYVTKIDQQHREYKPVILCSHGIGSRYVKSDRINNNTFNEKNTRDVYFMENGRKIALPIYYRNKLYSEEEREKLWLYKLDEQKRFVNGQMVKVDETFDHYFRLLNQERKRNAMLGFGSSYVNWNRKEYELQMRELKQATRLSTRRR